jgi:hypothetical protein
MGSCRPCCVARRGRLLLQRESGSANGCEPVDIIIASRIESETPTDYLPCLASARLSTNHQEGSDPGDAHQTIVGGTQTNGQEFPFFVRGQYGCAAVLIGNDIVLGVNHCSSKYRYGCLDQRAALLDCSKLSLTAKASRRRLLRKSGPGRAV